MRKPGHKASPVLALREAKEQFKNCPVCADAIEEHKDPARVVCKRHGYFTIRWSIAKKKVVVTWNFRLYLEDEVR
jgi:uncharacterized C2H2 Zn-finger protein